MSSPAIATVIKMMESLSKDKQNELVEHLREYIPDLQEELKWQNSFNQSQDKLARQQIADGKSTKDPKKSNSSDEILDILNNFIVDKYRNLKSRKSKNKNSSFLAIFLKNKWSLLRFFLISIFVSIFLLLLLRIAVYYSENNLEIFGLSILILSLLIILIIIASFYGKEVCKFHKKIKSEAVARAFTYEPEVYQRVIYELSENFYEEELYKEEIRFEIAIRERKRSSSIFKKVIPLIAILLVGLVIFRLGMLENKEQISLFYDTVVGVSGIVFVTRIILDIYSELLDENITIYETCISILQKAKLIAKEELDAIKAYDIAKNSGNEAIPFESIVSNITETSPVKKPLRRGSAKGKVWMSEDFDKPLSDVNEYM